MPTPHARWPGLLLGPLLVAAPRAQDPDPRIDRVHVLFAGLKLPRVADRPFVRVWTGEKTWRRDRYHNSDTPGFLLADERERFQVLTADLRVAWFHRTPPRTPRIAQVGYIGESLKGRASALRHTLLEAKADGDRNSRTLGQPPIHHTPVLEALVLAWQCRARGFLELAAGLDAAVLALDESPHDEVYEELRYNHLWHLLAGFADPGDGWPDIAAGLERFRRRFPTGRHREWLPHHIDTLRRMIAEDRRRPGRPPAHGTKALIAELRTQQGREGDTCGSCDIFRDPRGAASPAHRLRAAGLDAVPDLLAALDDDSFTRAVGITLQANLQNCVLRVRDCAGLVLGSIAHRSFGGRPSAVKHDAHQWWKEVREKGETRALSDAVARGDEHSLSQARYLAEKDRDLARAALREGIARATDEKIGARLRALLDSLR